MSDLERERILKVAMEAGCDEAERLGYGSELGYVEAASIGNKAAAAALDQLAGAVGERDRLRDWLRYIEATTDDHNIDAAVELALKGEAVEWGQ